METNVYFAIRRFEEKYGIWVTNLTRYEELEEVQKLVGETDRKYFRIIRVIELVEEMK